MAPPFRADHIGSLLRPQDLLDAQNATASGLYSRIYSRPASADAVRRSVAWVASEQLARGIRPITSGEYTRYIFYSGLFETLSGFEVRNLPIPDAFRSQYPTTTMLAQKGVKERSAVVCTGKIEWKSSAYLQEWEMVRGNVPKEMWPECKITVPSPTYQHIQLKPGTAYLPDVYASDDQYFADLSEAYRKEFRALYEAGVRNVQVDDPNLTFFCSEQFLDGCRQDGVEPDQLLDLYIRVHNDCIRGLPDDLHVGVHLCRGNFSGSTHFATGSYEKIAEKLFRALNYRTFFLEYDTDRAGGLEPLRYLPVDKNIVLGVVSTKTKELENVDELNKRVLEAADVIANAQGRTREQALDQLAVSPQCGFSSAASGGGTGVDMEVMWRKFELVQELAKRVWG